MVGRNEWIFIKAAKMVKAAKIMIWRVMAALVEGDVKLIVERGEVMDDRGWVIWRGGSGRSGRPARPSVGGIGRIQNRPGRPPPIRSWDGR
jgi:hypothetical protein